MRNIHRHHIIHRLAHAHWRRSADGRFFDECEQGGGAGRHGRFRRRMFDGGELRLALLRFLSQGPRHGYDFIRDMEERTSGAYAPSPGIVYPTLTLLQDLGHIEEVQAEGPKRSFAITAAGQAFLAEHAAEADAASKRVDALAAEHRRVDAGPIYRAMQNLRVALKQRLTVAQDQQILFSAAEIIDEAARKIERL